MAGRRRQIPADNHRTSPAAGFLVRLFMIDVNETLLRTGSQKLEGFCRLAQSGGIAGKRLSANHQDGPLSKTDLLGLGILREINLCKRYPEDKGASGRLEVIDLVLLVRYRTPLSRVPHAIESS
jgi:hypothetical protein